MGTLEKDRRRGRERTRQSSAFKEAAVAIAMFGAKMMAARDAEGKGVRLWHMLRKRDHDLPVKLMQSTVYSGFE